MNSILASAAFALILLLQPQRLRGAPVDTIVCPPDITVECCDGGPEVTGVAQAVPGGSCVGDVVAGLYQETQVGDLILRTWIATNPCLPVAEWAVCVQRITLLHCDTDPPFIDLGQTEPAATDDTPAKVEAKFFARAKAATRLNACLPILPKTRPDVDRGDFGIDYHVRLLARLAYKDYFGSDLKVDGGNARQEAIESLNVLYNYWQTAKGDWHIGTDSPIDGFWDEVKSIFANAFRHGDFDALMNALMAAACRFGPLGTGQDRNVLPPEVYDHILSMMDLTTPNVETFDTSLTVAGIGVVCPVACPIYCAGNPICLVDCPGDCASAKIHVPETENHLNLIYASRYLANQLLYAKTHDPQYDNYRITVGGRTFRNFLRERLRSFIRQDFIEYNSHPYAIYTMPPLLNLCTYAEDRKLREDASNVLNYVSAKVAVSSNDGRRSTPYRRKRDPSYNSPNLVAGPSDPQTGFYMMLAGVTDLAGPFASRYEFQWAAMSGYRIPDLILDLFVNRDHRKFLQFFHYCRLLQFGDRPDCNDELYAGSPSFLICAGGHITGPAYMAALDDPLTSFPPASLFKRYKDDDVGVTQPTFLMPTRDGRIYSRDQMLRFSQLGYSMGVARNFACGLHPDGLDTYLIKPVNVPAGSPWYFIKAEKSGQPGDFGYYVAFYRIGDSSDGWGFFEAYDTKLDPSGFVAGANGDSEAAFAGFRNRVLLDNYSSNFSRSADKDHPNVYKASDGSVIQFAVDDPGNAEIFNPPYDPNRTSGDILNYDPVKEQLTISNPYFQGGKSLVIDAGALPSNACTPEPGALITVPSDVTIAGTCIGETGLGTLYVCNTGSGNLCVYNILSTNADFEVTEPSSGYPVTISPDFCFPFQVKFSPSSAGSVRTTVAVSSSDAGKPSLDVRITGKGLQPSISTVIASGGEFGDVCVGDYTDLDLTINNSGGCNLMISAIRVSDTEFSAPTVTGFPLVIQPGAAAHVPIRLKPTSFGPKSANVEITSNDPAMGSITIAVSGNTPSGEIRVTGSTDFGDVCSETLAEKTIQICNVGSCDLRVTSVAFVPSCPDFTLVNNPFPATVSHDSCLAVTIRLTPTSCGPKSCTLVIISDDPTSRTNRLTLTANTPCPEIDVPPDLGFAPEVVQNIGACTTALAFPISNKGQCSLTITGITIGGVNVGDFSLSGLPSFPVILEPGHEVGEGDLNIVFAPTVVARARQATITVTYISNPITGETTDVTRKLCGEGVNTGARVLVMQGGIPLAKVESIHLQRINANRNKNLLDTQDVAKDLPLVTVVPTAPCEPFQYHREYGTVSNPIQLLPGSYQVTVAAIINGKRTSKTVGFNVDTCDFNPNVVVGF